MNKCGSRSGSSLTEAIMALFLMSIAFLGVYSLGSGLLRMDDFSRRVAEATAICGDKIEDLLGLDFADVNSGTDNVDIFVRKWRVTTNGLWRAKNVTVTVSWQTLDGASQDIVLRTVINQ